MHLAEHDKDRIRMLHERMVEDILDYAIILLNLDGTVLSWNKGAEAIKGYKAAEIIGQNFKVFYLPQEQKEEIPLQYLKQALVDGRVKYIGKRVRKDGSTFWGSMLVNAIHDDSGAVIGFT